MSDERRDRVDDRTTGVPEEAGAADAVPDRPGAPAKRRKESIGQTIGGVLFGFEQQVLRTMPPPQELVHHARPDAPVPAGDGSLIHIGMPGIGLPDNAIAPPEGARSADVIAASERVGPDDAASPQDGIGR